MAPDASAIYKREELIVDNAIHSSKVTVMRPVPISTATVNNSGGVMSAVSSTVTLVRPTTGNKDMS